MHFWHIQLARLIRSSYYSRTTVIGAEHLPEAGPTLYVALHRNGAIDGAVYAPVVPRAWFMISTQWRKSALGRALFPGVEVVRSKDQGDRARNREAMAESLALLERGGELLILPEGTSDLGPKHLPFRHGAARIAQAALAEGVPLRIVPLGIHYERAWAFRSRVEVVVGKPLDLRLPSNCDDIACVALLHERITQGLEAVGAQFATAHAQQEAENLAYVATLATPRTYFGSLKQLEPGVPARIRAAAGELERVTADRAILRHQGVPLVPMGPLLAYACLFALLLPVVAIAGLLNAPPLAVAHVAGARLADGRNVIALWRVLAGLPAFALWIALVVAACLVGGCIGGLVGYVLASIAALATWYRFKKLAVATLNGARHSDLRPALLGFRQIVIEELDRARN